MHLAEKLGLGVVTVGCGREHTVAVVDGGQVFSWGWGECGRLGVGEVGKVLVPARVPEFVGLDGGGGAEGSEGGGSPAPKAKDVACGREHTLIVSERGLVFVCGPGTLGR
jgi:alpha-tubulin suppressor-like RCC1 family protein